MLFQANITTSILHSNFAALVKYNVFYLWIFKWIFQTVGGVRGTWWTDRFCFFDICNDHEKGASEPLWENDCHRKESSLHFMYWTIWRSVTDLSDYKGAEIVSRECLSRSVGRELTWNQLLFPIPSTCSKSARAQPLLLCLQNELNATEKTLDRKLLHRISCKALPQIIFQLLSIQLIYLQNYLNNKWPTRDYSWK